MTKKYTKVVKVGCENCLGGLKSKNLVTGNYWVISKIILRTSLKIKDVNNDFRPLTQLIFKLSLISFYLDVCKTNSTI